MKVEILFASLWALSLTVLIVGTVSLVIRKPRKSNSRSDKEGISILKPLKGIDPGLKENLESFFKIEYPNFEIIFSVANGSDPAVPLVHDLIKKHPKVNAKLVISNRTVGFNPKVNNLMTPYENVANDLIVVSDSNVFVTPNYLNEIADEFQDPDLGALTALVAAHQGKGIVGRAESLHLNNYCARGMLISELAGQEFVMGKSMSFRKSDSEKFGGLMRLSNYLAEDFMMGEAMKWIGKKVKVASSPVFQRVGTLTAKGFYDRHLRWARIRKCHTPAVLLLEVFTNSILSSLFVVLSTLNLGLSVTLTAVLIHLGIFALCDWWSSFALQNRLGLLSFLPTWVYKEFNGVAVWLTSWTGNTVSWRGGLIRLSSSGIIEGYVGKEDSIFVGSCNEQPSN
jgi:ceramide glucosyltransferase